MRLPSRRIKIKAALHKGKPFKGLCFGKNRTGGRNNTGRITAPHRGGGAKRLIRILDWKRNEFPNIMGQVVTLEYDPGRTAHVALVKYPLEESQSKASMMMGIHTEHTENGSAKYAYRYILAPNGLKVGDMICSGKEVEPNLGNSMPLEEVPEGMMVHNIELSPGQGAKVARAAGAYARITGRDGDFINLKMRSGEIRSFSKHCMATIGIVSNLEHFNERIGKAGVNVNRGIRPTVRGIAMNPVDHHNGGRTNGGKRLSNFNGKCIRGKKTRNPRKLSNSLIVRRRKS